MVSIYHFLVFWKVLTYSQTFHHARFLLFLNCFFFFFFFFCVCVCVCVLFFWFDIQSLSEGSQTRVNVLLHPQMWPSLLTGEGRLGVWCVDKSLVGILTWFPLRNIKHKEYIPLRNMKHNFLFFFFSFRKVVAI